jgi:signal transduction histidine kinase
MQSYWAGEDLTGEVFVEGEPLALPGIAEAPPQRRQIALEEGICSILCVPIRLGEQTIGVFELDFCQVHRFDDEERRFLLAFTQRAVMAVGNARLYEQAQQAAVLFERQRMARELHDSVTQSLYSLTLVAEAGRRLAASGEPEQAVQYIERMGETARQALKDMRLMVFEMRPFELAEIGLVRALQQRLDAVEKRAGIEAHLQVEGDLDLPEWLDEALYRIAQEALNNALKHAAASRIAVVIRGSDACVELEVSDNGVGFNTQAAVHQGGMGLENMLERARQIGAELRLISQPGEGTTVLVRAAFKPDQAGQ